MSVPAELKSKRAELEERLRELSEEIASAKDKIGAIDKVIAIYEPEWQPSAAKTRRRGRAAKSDAVKKAEDIISRTNKRQMTLDILRTAGRPLSTMDCAAEFARRHEIDTDDAVLAAISSRVSPVLGNLQKAGRVRHAGHLDGHRRRWEIDA